MFLGGSGDKKYEDALANLSRRFSSKLVVRMAYDERMAHLIEAGADFFLMPSRFEPCGLNQMYSLRYGTLPIVRATGGLADTVRQYDEATGGGTGFLLDDLTPSSLTDTIGWALSTWWDRPHHITGMRLRAMAEDFSWERSAREYEQLYLDAYRRRRGVEFGE